MEPGVTNHLGDDKSPEKDFEHSVSFAVYSPLTPGWLIYGATVALCRVITEPGFYIWRKEEEEEEEVVYSEAKARI